MARRAPGELWPRLKPIARQNRARATSAEEVLWQALRRGALSGFKFRRQHVIDRFIVDFYCAKARLVLEVDGPVHDRTPLEDSERQEHLEGLNLRVLRFRNEQVLGSLAQVLSEIEGALRTSPPAAATPSPQRGEGDRGD